MADGLKAAVDAAIEERGALLPLGDAEQMDMLRDDRGHLMPHAPAEARRAGRPRGSVNKRTAKVRDYLLSRYAHPLEVLAQIYTRPTDVLAAELGCTREAAIAIQTKAAAEVAPYVEGKMPVQVDVTSGGLPVMILPGFNAPIVSVDELGRRVAEDGLDAIDWTKVETAEFQEVSE